MMGKRSQKFKCFYEQCSLWTEMCDYSVGHIAPGLVVMSRRPCVRKSPRTQVVQQFD